MLATSSSSSPKPDAGRSAVAPRTASVSRRRALAWGLGAVAVALILTLAVTWPLAACLGRCLGPPPDTLLSVYFLAWTAHALRTPGVALLDAPMFAPYPRTLALGAWMPAVAPLAVPTIWLTGNPVLAHNLALLALYTAGAVGAATLARRLLGSASAALVGGVAFAYSPRLLEQAYNLQTLGIAWLPWVCLALERALARPSWGPAASLALAVLALGLTSANLLIYAGLPLVVLAAGLVAVRPHRLDARGLVRLGLTGAGAAAVLWAFLAPLRRAAVEWGLERSLGEAEDHALTPAHVLRPPPEALLRAALGRVPEAPLAADGLVQGLALLGLALAGLVLVVRRVPGPAGALGPYVVAAGLALVLAFGPTLATPWGALPLPYRLLHALLPGATLVRTPSRFVLVVDLVFALLAGAGAMRLLGRLASGPLRGAAAAGLGGLVLLESVLLPFPGAVPRLDPAHLPDGYRWLAQTPPGTVALVLPMGDWVNVAASAFHLRRTVNGWASFYPPRYPELVAAMAGFPDARSMALVRAIRPDVVLVDRAWLTPARGEPLSRPDSPLRFVAGFRSHLAFRVAAPAPPGVEALEVEAGAGACVGLRNPGREFAPLYPAHRLRLEATPAVGRGAVAAHWLPVDLAPGARHVVCVPGGAPGATLRGAVEGGGRRYGFVVAPGRPATRPRLEGAP
jgi:hypothetical protein